MTEKKAAAEAVEPVAAAVKTADEQGFYGYSPDPRDPSEYTVPGVIAAAKDRAGTAEPPGSD